MKKNILKKKEMIEIHKLAVPILCNYLVTTVFELLDEAIVGHYSTEGFALVGIAASIIFAVTGTLGILASTFHILAANKKGEQDEVGFLGLFRASKWLAVIIGTVFVVISVLGGKYFFHRMYQLEGKQLSEILSYFYPAAITVLQNLLIFQYSAYFRNKLNTKISLLVTGVSTVVNLFFDYSLVYGKFGLPEIGIAGAAWGSVIGLFCGLLIYQWCYVKEAGIHFRIELSYWKDIGKLYPTLFGQELLEGTIYVLVVTAVVARLGTTQMAVYKVVDILIATLSLPAYAYATAAQTYAIQNHVAKRTDAVRRYLRTGILSGILLIAVLCIGTWVGQSVLLSFLIDDVSINGLVGQYLGYAFLYVILKVPYQTYMSYLQGIERDRYVLLGTTVGTIASSILIVIFGIGFGLTGIYGVMILQYLILGGIYRHQSGRVDSLEEQ